MMSERENTISYTRLTSFLRKDTSFLSPWSWPVRNRNAAAVNIETSSSRNVEQYLLQPGSYFESIWVSFLFRLKSIFLVSIYTQIDNRFVVCHL